MYPVWSWPPSLQGCSAYSSLACHPSNTLFHRTVTKPLNSQPIKFHEISLPWVQTFEFAFVEFLEVVDSSSLYLNPFSVSVLLSSIHIHTEESYPFLVCKNWKKCEELKGPQRKKKNSTHTLLYILRPRENESKCETTEPTEKDITRLTVS